MTFLEKAKAVMIGHAIGDALGVPVEFITRQELKENPVTDMKGYGTYPVPAGAWSDDTSMALCALETFNGCKINFDKVMINFARWYYQDLFTPTGEMFDVGNTCSMAIEKYMKENVSWHECGLMDERSNGNGSLMRIHPFALYTFLLDTNITTKVEIIELASALTHGHKRSRIGCAIYAFILWELLNIEDKNEKRNAIRRGIRKAELYYHEDTEFKHYSRLYRQIAHVNNLANDEEDCYWAKEEDIISDGYIVHTLEAAVWCLLKTKSYEECVLKAVNLGDDTDTTAAVAGGLAGAIYGIEGIPERWKNKLIKKDYIESLCDKAFHN